MVHETTTVVDTLAFALFGNLFEAILVCGCSQSHGFRPTTTLANTSLRQRLAWSHKSLRAKRFVEWVAKHGIAQGPQMDMSLVRAVVLVLEQT